MELLQRIADRKAKIGVIGLGYVGLPLAVEFARAGFHVVGYDVDATKTATLNGGVSYIPDVPTAHVAEVVARGLLRATTDASELADVDVIDICVPTPLRKTKDPDLSYIVQAVEATAKVLRQGQLIILESTTYPGTTDEVVQPALEAGGLEAGTRLLSWRSRPSASIPATRTSRRKNIPKVVGGMNEPSTQAAAALYGSIIDTIVPVSSTRVAEMVKLLENTFRAVNIGLVNETGADVRPHGHRRVGSDRRGQDQAVRFHAVLPRARVSAATASRSIRSTCPGRPSRAASRRASSSWPVRSTAPCPSTS